MQSHISLGKVFGIKVGVHLSWVLIAILLTVSLATRFSVINPNWGSEVIWLTAIITGLLFFSAIVAHELAHALVARMRGLPVNSITLFALGGVAMIEKEAADPATEFWMGIAGPIMSVFIGTVCLSIAMLLGWSLGESPFEPSTPLMAALVWLGWINIGLAAFNMLPGFPLDGGRVLRAVIWYVTNDAVRATRIAARLGQIIATLFIVFGIFQFFFGIGWGAIWLAFIGWFLLNAASSSYAHLELSQTLRHLDGLTARDVMQLDCYQLDSKTTLQDFVSEHLLRTGGRCYFVTNGQNLAGLVTLHEVKGVPKELWASKTVGEVMRPVAELQTIAPETPVRKALEMMIQADVNQLPVVSDGRAVGMISRNRILELLQARAELAA
ncbi:MAG: site-2 protease family protein [Chloroherpetonaceae bacterium]|nr:site-2 protease family protein [Chloroherpetonaceae bacterium]MCS7212437.1 site-2 protease family protein [Chloroherpetonaceae bacterium]MDW8019308.1 site-2 protease family protein [Chloroherpetonaceae bacterium]MDW8465501.1 site-2 protease family protein [Chloroherpetonaceae bacterium]